MNEEVYDYLREYGFTKEDLTSFESINPKIFDVDYDWMIDNISFLEKFDFSKKEIIKLIRKNCFLISLSIKKRNYFDKIFFDILGFTREEIKDLMIKYPDLYIENPLIIERKINGMYKDLSLMYIKNMIKEKPSILKKS